MLSQAEFVDSWAQFGLAGLVIFSLFTALGLIVKWLIAHVDSLSARHSEERKEWQDENNKVVTKVDASMMQLTDSIKELTYTVREKKNNG